MLPWIFLLLALAALAVAFKTTSVAVVVICLLAAFGLTLAWVLGLLAQRVERRRRDESQILDPVELHRMREQAEARRVAAAQSTPSREGGA